MNTAECLELLHAELKPAIGCTEPAAIALAAARTMDYLQEEPVSLEVELSGNIYKNAFAVTIPGTGESGVALAAALGAVLPNARLELQLFEEMTPECLAAAKGLLAEDKVKIVVLEPAPEKFYLHVKAKGKKREAETWTEKYHTNMTRAALNGRPIMVCPDRLPGQESRPANTNLTSRELRDLVVLAEQLPVDDLEFLLEGVKMNKAMAAEGLKQRAGLGLGWAVKSLMDAHAMGGDLLTRIRIEVAAACDGRMGGIKQPVMSTTGSGNQGILVSLPIALVAEERKLSKEKVLRGLALGNLITAYVKQFIGKLTPICGCAIAAGLGVAGAVAWMLGGSPEQVEAATRNMMANLAGMICDGAKGGCAFKLASSASESVLAALLALEGVEVGKEEGIVSCTLKETVENVAILCTKGMANQDQALIEILQRKQARVG
ncbi:MAG: L-serine ammonia-lyase, iron-sulfur-dependent, subunit alpha [Peptococcaceae bacterium]|nr:L-serine ammonia-lyase, iron-sulfur-dependent, subunit alpha [Peptococcaceae bacterium]